MNQTNDRGLLEKAAKAAGWVETDFLSYANDGLMNVYDADGHQAAWNPLTNDGDAFRLAVKLEISIVFGANYIIVNGSVQVPTVNNANDPGLAVRRAIVIAAAEIGRAMP